MREYCVPDYYPEFVCKGGACRTSCCTGWPISMPMNEYFRLVGLDCPPEIRRKLDVALHIVENPSPDRYAQILPNWTGDCPMHAEDGLCMLQCACGEDALTGVCRLYPRSPRTAFACECACSNSCEHTLELLFSRPDPMRFIKLPLVCNEPPEEKAPDVARRHYIDIRRMCIDTLQDRSRPLSVRIIRLGDVLRHIHGAFLTGDDAQIDRALEQLPDPPAVSGPDERFALSFLEHINRTMGMNSRSVGDYARHAAELFALDGDEPDGHSIALWRAARERFRCAFPDWEIRLEKALVNHVFYESFPFSDRFENLWDEFLSLSAAFAYSTFLAVAWTQTHPGEEALVDALAAAYRLIDHSRFDWNVAAILDSRMHVSEAAMDAFVLAIV